MPRDSMNQNMATEVDAPLRRKSGAQGCSNLRLFLVGLLLLLSVCSWSQLAQSPWPKTFAGYHNSSIGPKTHTDGSIKWTTAGSNQWGPLGFGTPLVIGVDGTVYGLYWDYLANDGMPYANLAAIDGATGAVKWKAFIGPGNAFGATIDVNGNIYLCLGTKLYCVDSSGNVKWSFASLNAIYGVPAVGPDGTIYFGSTDNFLYAVSPTGNLLQSLRTYQDIRSSPAFADDGTFYIGVGNDLMQFDKNLVLKAVYKTLGAVVSTPVISDDGSVYVGSEDGQIYSLRPNKTFGPIFWTGAYVVTTPALGPDGTLYIPSGDWTLYAIDPISGSPKWSFQANSVIDHTPSVGGDGTVFLPTNDGFLYALNASDGAVLWKMALPSHQNGPAIGLDGTLYNPMGASGIVALTSVSVVAITLEPITLASGGSGSGTVGISQPAPASGIAVNLSADNAAVSLPATVTIPAGEQMATFTYQVGGVNSKTTANISASLGNKKSAALTIIPVAASLISFNPTSISAGSTSVGTVTINGPGAIGGTDVALSSNSGSVAVPLKVTVPAGQTTATFTATANGVNLLTTATVTATLNGQSLTAQLTVNPAALSGLSVSPMSISGGGSSTGTVTLDGPAGSSGVTVSLTSSNAIATVPATVTVAAGQKTATFNISTVGVNSQSIATITATLGAVTKTAILTVDPATLNSLSLSPISVIGGSSATATLTLSGPAGSGGTSVAVASSDPSATVPAMVKVAEGSSSATFQVSTNAVNAQTQATITVTLNSLNKTANLTVNPATLQSVSLSPNSVPGGTSSTGTVTLSGPAGPGGTTVSLGDNSASATVPANVIVQAGQTSANFQVTTLGVDGQTTVTITGTLNSTQQSATLTITATSIASVSVNPTSVTGGTSSIGTVSLTGNAGPSGVVVSMKSDNVAASIPSTVTILSGQKSANFTVSTIGVNAKQVVNVSASLGVQALSCSLTVNPAILNSLTLNPTSVQSGNGATGTVTLSGPAGTGGTVIALTSDSVSVIPPASVTVLAGQTSATFQVSTTAVSAQTVGTVTGSLNGQSQSASLTLLSSGVASVSLNPTSVVGGSSATGTVTLAASAGLGGAVVNLTSSSSSAIVQATVTVPSGQKSSTFAVATSLVSNSTTSTISAAFAGITQSAVLSITSDALVSVTLNPQSVAGGSSSQGTVTIAGPAPAGGLTIALSTNGAFASVPPSVTIPAGNASIGFVVNTKPVTVNSQALISASVNGGTQSATLNVNPLALTEITLSPSSVTGGTSVSGTVFLNGSAPTGGALIHLSSNLANAVVPATVTISAGQASANFSVVTTPVATIKSATIVGKLGSSTTSETLTLNPPGISSISLMPSVVLGGASSIGTITLTSKAPSTGLVVKLASSSSSATVPASITIGAGKLIATFGVKTIAVGVQKVVAITGSVNGSSKTASLTINPPNLVSLSLSPASVIGGKSSSGTVTISSPAPLGGLVVTLFSDKASATLPGSVTIAAGRTSGSFVIKTTKVSSKTIASISASLNSVNKTSSLTIQ